MWFCIEGNYDVNEFGEIRNRKMNRILKPFAQGNYLGVWLGAGNKHKIHRIVATCLLPRCIEDDLVVDHIDRNPHNNHASNLRWVSRSVNSKNRTVEMKARISNTHGEHHIAIVMASRQINPSYVVKGTGVYKCFNLLEEAIKYRNEIYK